MRAALRGQAAVEFLYVIPILLILLFGAMQFTFIYEAKLTLNQAVFAGTRQGALNNGAMSAIQDGLEAGLTPLFIIHGKEMQDLKDARDVAHNLLTKKKLATTAIVNPNGTALSGFQKTWTENGAAITGIPNDNLMYRDPGIVQGGMNIQDANLLKVRVKICYPLIVPIINRIIYSVVSGLAPTPVLIDSSTYTGQSIAAPELLKSAPLGTGTGTCPPPGEDDGSGKPVVHYSIPITSEAVVRMQSPFKNPGNWTYPP